jgi:hypothetical protein
MNFTTQEIIGIALMSLSFIAIPILEAYLARLQDRDTEEHLTRAILNAALSDPSEERIVDQNSEVKS